MLRAVVVLLSAVGALAAEAADLPADAPRSLLRGTVTLADGGAVLRSCGQKGRDYWIEDAAAAEIQKIYGLFVPAGGTKPVFMEIRGVVTYGPKSGPGSRYDRALAVDSVIRAEGEGRGCYNNLRRVEARALGVEPGWQVELTRAGGTFASLQNPAMQLFQARPLERDADGTLRYEGTAIDAKLVLTLKPERCRDAMSGNVFSYSALATLDGREYRGCGYVGDAFLAKR